jgi:glycosyltransferase involved in cell wall biosynthesis
MRALWQEVGAADVVHVHGTRVVYSALAGAFALLRRKKLIYTAHCFYVGKTRRQALLKYVWDHTIERTLLAFGARSILLSEYWREYLRRRALPVRRSIALPNGVDVAALQNETVIPMTLSGAPAVLSVCRLDPVKRVEDSIAALIEPGMEWAELHIVGCGADEVRLRSIAAQKKVASRVHFHGYKTDAEVAAMARAADVFVIASAEEGMPTTILEMLARGVPVVASDIPGNRSLTEPLDWPHTYPCRDVVALARTIRAAVGQPIPPTVTQTLTEQFDWHGIGQRMLQHYEAV